MTIATSRPVVLRNARPLTESARITSGCILTDTRPGEDPASRDRASAREGCRVVGRDVDADGLTRAAELAAWRAIDRERKRRRVADPERQRTLQQDRLTLSCMHDP